MKKTLLFSLAFSLFTVPLTVNAATNQASETAKLQDSQSQVIAGFGILDDMKDTVEGAVDLVEDTEEDSGAINDGAGNLKTKFNGGESEESDEIVEEEVVEEGTETSENDNSEDSGSTDFF